MTNKKNSKSKVKTTSETTTIDLNIIHNPNSEIIRRYKEANAESLWGSIQINDNFYTNASYNGEHKFFKIVTNSGNPVKHEINAIYRKVLPGGREVCWFNEHLITEDHLQNYTDFTRTLGKFDAPLVINHQSRDARTGEQRHTPEVIRHETIYSWDWEGPNGIKDQLQSWYDRKVPGVEFDENCQYIVFDSNGQKLAKPFSHSEYFDNKIENLRLLGLYGKKFHGLSMSTEEIIKSIKESLTDVIKKGLTGIAQTPSNTA
jgi:hypothetical protein